MATHVNYGTLNGDFPENTQLLPDNRPRLSASEESERLQESNALREEANNLFKTSCSTQATTGYRRALSICPHYLDYEVAALKCNLAACFVKMKDWDGAVETATAALEALNLIPFYKPTDEERALGCKFLVNQGHSPAMMRVLVDGFMWEEKKKDIRRIRMKALMRRGTAFAELGGSANLRKALEDFTKSLKIPKQPTDAHTLAHSMVETLPERILAAVLKEG